MDSSRLICLSGSLYSAFVGTLRWVLSTGLPTPFRFSNLSRRERVVSSKERLELIKTIEIDVDLPGIGAIKGDARIYEKPLTGGKSADLARSHGFFVRVRERVINLEDEPVRNHSAKPRSMGSIRLGGARRRIAEPSSVVTRRRKGFAACARVPAVLVDGLQSMPQRV